jgi:hypothetical protein
MVILCAIGAAAATRRIVALSAEAAKGSSPFAGLDQKFAAEAGILLLHIVPALLFVLLLPLQFVPSLRRRHPVWHRWSGRIIAALGIILGVSALQLSMHPVGGIVEASATVLFGCFFLFALGKAWWHIRNRRIKLHEEWMTRMAGIVLGVAMTRPIMGVFFATSRLTGLTPQQFFGPAMWLGFVSTWLAAETWIRYHRSRHAVQVTNRPPSAIDTRAASMTRSL